MAAKKLSSSWELQGLLLEKALSGHALCQVEQSAQKAAATGARDHPKANYYLKRLLEPRKRGEFGPGPEKNWAGKLGT